MFPRPFDYFSPSTLSEALELIKSGDAETRILAGGQSLLPAMKARNLSPKKLVDLGGIRELNFISKDEHGLKIGATTTTATIENDLEIACLVPILQETAGEIADPLVRNLGTVGGNLCHADPVNDFPPAMLAVNATFTLASAQKTRSIVADEFFVDRFKTAAKSNEILTQIQIPLRDAKVGNAYRKIRKGSGGFTIAGVAAQIEVDDENVISGCRIALSGVGSKALRALRSEAALLGKTPEAAVLGEAAWLAVEASEPNSDITASAEYRRKVLAVLVKDAVEVAYKRAVMGNYE
jgi:carbon-monoxide dehydrogenase medium subunit